MKTGLTPHRHGTIDSLIRVGVLFVLAAMSVAPGAFAAITTFAPDCVTPKKTFNLGETVCARVDNLVGYRAAWMDPDGFIVQRTNVTSDPQTDSFALPSTGQSSIAGLFTANNIGQWRVAATASGNSIKSVTFFMVRDPASARADLEIFNDVIGGDTPVAGGALQYLVTLVNRGPDDAVNAHFVDNQFTNATFNSIVQTDGPHFSCLGADCTIASFPAGAVATFVLNFTAGSAGGVLENTATFTSDTPEIDSASNSSDAPPFRVGTSGTPPACSLDCGGNIVVSATTVNQGVLGSFITFPQPDAFGECGPITLSPASGSFFAVGSTTVSATASGGGSCSFTVTVIDTPPPTIACPADLTTIAPSGQLTAFVPDPNAPASNPGNATATGSGISVFATRSDDAALSDPYPIGVTVVTWTATDDGGRVASCTQRVKVTSPDAPTIHCPSDKTFTAPAGQCEITVLAEDLGVPSASGMNVSITATRSDNRPLTDPYPAGDTIITWTATNLLGNASCTQRIHVKAVDIQPPTLTIPPDITTSTSSCFVVLDDELGVATATDDCSGSVSVARTGVPPHFIFPTGITNITYTAIDAAGNVASKVQRVTVIESPAIRPTINPPADISASTGAGSTKCGVVVSDTALGTATATDNCPGVAVSRSGVPTGNFFPVGDTFITWTATDASGNTSSASQRVRVADTTPPIVLAPASVTLFTGPDATTCGVHVASLDATLGTATAVDNCSAGPVTRSGVPANNDFPVGVTTLTYSTTDSSGNPASATQTVTVVDNTPPAISCPPNMTLEPTCPSGAIAAWTEPVGTDNCPNPTTKQTAGPASGTVLAIGTTTVSYTVTDAANNQTSCSFTVTVLTVVDTIKNLKTSVSGASLPGPQQQGLIPKLDSALSALDKQNTKQACQMIGNFASQVQTYIDHGNVPASQGQAWLASAAHIANALGCTNNPCQ